MQMQTQLPLAPVSTVFDKAFERALNMIIASGAQYTLHYAGQSYTNVVPAKQDMKRTRSGMRYTHTFKDRLAAMAIGDLIVLKLPAGGNLEHLRSCASGCCVRQFGVGSGITSIDVAAQEVHVLRVM